jgi:hypothetical protein
MVAARDQTLQEYSQFIDSALSDEEARQLEAILAKLVNRFKQA